MVVVKRMFLLIDMLLTMAYWYGVYVANGTGDCLTLCQLIIGTVSFPHFRLAYYVPTLI